MDFNQMNNNPVQPDPNAFNAQQPYGQPQGGFAGQPYDAMNQQAQAGYAQQPFDAMNQQAQAGYAQPAYDAMNQQSYGWNGGYSTDTFGQGNSAPVKCPGKEITGMVFGIGAIGMGVAAVIIGIVCIAAAAAIMSTKRSLYSLGYGSLYSPIAQSAGSLFAYGYIWGIMAVGFAIVTMVLRGQIYAVAQEISNKIKAGFGLALAGIISGGIGLLLTIIATAMANA